MRLSRAKEKLGWWGLSATPEDYDGVPLLSTVWFDRGPRVLSADRLALAGYLLFGHFSSGRLATPIAHAPALAQAIARDAHPVWLQTEPVELYAKPLPFGQRPAHVYVEGITAGEVSGESPRVGHQTLRVRRSDRGSGASFTFDGLEVWGNAWLFAANADPRVQRRIALGCGVLYAEDLAADRLVIPLTGVPEDEQVRLRDLLSAVRLGLDAA